MIAPTKCRELKCDMVMRGLSQRDVATELDISEAELSHLLSGRRVDDEMFERVKRHVNAQKVPKVKGVAA